MSEMSRDDLLEIVRTVWTERDPVPEGLVTQLQAALVMAGSDLDVELMLLVERSTELAGARGGATASYTLRFAHGDTDLLLRIAPDGEESRVDGWIVPPEPMTIRALSADGEPLGRAVVSDKGRFELTGLPTGLMKLRLEAHDLDRPAFATPTFEI